MLITYWEKNSLGKSCEYVSHGINSKTGEVVIMPQERIEYYIQECGAKPDEASGEFVMEIKISNN
jgi:hypothetical protein